MIAENAKLVPLYNLETKKDLYPVFFNWGLMICFWTILSLDPHPSFFKSVVVIFLLGNRYYTIFTMGHDGFHRRLSKKLKTNDWINNLLCVGPVGGITRLNRDVHMQHHQVFATIDDPDRYKYLTYNKKNKRQFILMITGCLFFFGRIIDVFFFEKRKKGSEKVSLVSTLKGKYHWYEVLILLGWQLGLFALLTYFISPFAYFWYWVLPVTFVTLNLDNIRVFCEHSQVNLSDEEGDQFRYICYECPWWEKLIFAPLNMNYHGLHHLYASIPYYNLPQAAKLIKLNPPSSGPKIIWRKSYFHYLYQYWKSLPW